MYRLTVSLSFSSSARCSLMTSLNELTPPPAEQDGSALWYCFVPAEEE